MTFKNHTDRANQYAGANITTPLVITTSQTFTPNQWPFKYKLYLVSGGSNGGYGSSNSTSNLGYSRFGGGGGSGTIYISSSTETLTSFGSSLVFSIGAAPTSGTVAKGGSTTVTRNDNAAIVGAYTTALNTPGELYGSNGGSGGGGAGGQRNSFNTGATVYYAAGYGGYDGGRGADGGFGGGGTGSTNAYISPNGVTSVNRGNDTSYPIGGNAYTDNVAGTYSGEVPPANWGGIVISGTTYLNGSNYGKGGYGGGTQSLGSFESQFAAVNRGGAGVAILEPIP